MNQNSNVQNQNFYFSEYYIHQIFSKDTLDIEFIHNVRHLKQRSRIAFINPQIPPLLFKLNARKTSTFRRKNPYFTKKNLTIIYINRPKLKTR